MFCFFLLFTGVNSLLPGNLSRGAVAPAGGLPGELLPQRGGLLCESILAPVEIYLFLQVASSKETPVLSNRLIVSPPPLPHPPSWRRKKIERQARQRRAGSAESLILPGATRLTEGFLSRALGRD